MAEKCESIFENYQCFIKGFRDVFFFFQIPNIFNILFECFSKFIGGYQGLVSSTFEHFKRCDFLNHSLRRCYIFFEVFLKVFELFSKFFQISNIFNIVFGCQTCLLQVVRLSLMSVMRVSPTETTKNQHVLKRGALSRQVCLQSYQGGDLRLTVVRM